MQIHPEENTIAAINKLKKSYPYAASLLVYVVIERQLKLYLLGHRNEKNNFKNYCCQSDDEFIKNCLTNLTLGKLEKKLKIKCEAATDRNNLMHSNLYLSGDKDLSDPERQNKNVKHFETAKTHLIRVFRDYCSIPIEEKEGLLVFKTRQF